MSKFEAIWKGLVVGLLFVLVLQVYLLNKTLTEYFEPILPEWSETTTQPSE